MNDELVQIMAALELAEKTILQAQSEIEALTAQLAEARESERAAMTEVNGLKDALAQVPEFICRKCGRRQHGPTDNEARF